MHILVRDTLCAGLCYSVNRYMVSMFNILYKSLGYNKMVTAFIV